MSCSAPAFAGHSQPASHNKKKGQPLFRTRIRGAFTAKRRQIVRFHKLFRTRIRGAFTALFGRDDRDVRLFRTRIRGAFTARYPWER